MSNEPASRAFAESTVVNRAQTDPDFRARLIADPKATLREAFELEIPDSLAVRVIEETPDEITIVLPPPPAQGSDVSDEELAAVSGGWDPCTTGCLTVASNSTPECTVPTISTCGG